ncbi:DUF6188 family protein [Cryptosporangium sp. NPDC048952]|uniref:DUF6188 family protein n=1 Tax=Cryptosporangium sp. NPDC048952 TaxID=3363961 RepID=UPI00372087E8
MTGRHHVPLPALVGPTIEAAEVSPLGLLTLTLKGGSSLAIEPDGRYEAWTVAGPAGGKVIFRPGGGFTAWSAIQADDR